METCDKRKIFVNIKDSTDMLVLACDMEKGHGGIHRDPTTKTLWYE